MIRRLSLVLTLSLAATQASAQAPQSHAPAKASDDSCFSIVNMQGDVPVDAHTVLFRVGVTDIYSLGFADSCPELTYPSPRLILTPVGGQGFICHAIDLDVKVGENGPGDIPVACIPTSLRKLTPAEVKALPKKDIP